MAKVDVVNALSQFVLCDCLSATLKRGHIFIDEEKEPPYPNF